MIHDNSIDGGLLGQLKFVRLFKITALNLHVIMMKSEMKMIILASTGNDLQISFNDEPNMN